MTDITIDAGILLFANEDPLAAQGLLVPFGVEARSNLGRFTVDAGVFDIPADVTGMSITEEHTRERVVGGITRVWEQPEGVLLAMRFADTPEGRAAAEDARSGKRRNLSVECADVRIKDGKAISGRIFGASVVERPAFAGATLLAAEDTDDQPTIEQRVEALESQVAELTPDPADAEEDTEPETPAEKEEANMAEATVPATLQATGDTKKELDVSGVFDAITAVRKGQDPTGTLLAALSDIKVNTTGGLTTAASGIIQPAWLGELWSGRAYVRKYMPLIRNGAIRAIDEKGFNVTAPSVAAWSGNKAELPTGTGSTTLVSSIFQRWAVAVDIAREFFDIPGNNEVIDAFIRHMVESYARVTDEWTLAQLVDTANNAIVAPETYPTDYPESLGQLIQGIAAVEDAGDTPTFAIANAAAWAELLYTPKDKVPEFVSFSVGTNGQGTADGRVRVVKGDLGIDDTPAVLVGASAAAHVNELPGASPLQVNALDIAHGGIDRAVHGYTQFGADHPAGLVLVGVADV